MNPLVWVAIPNGLSEPGVAAIRILVVPKLLGGKRIEDYGLGDWPGVLNGDFGPLELVLGTRANGGPSFEQRITATSHAQSSIWQEFFGGAAGAVNPKPSTRPRTVQVDETHRDAVRVLGTYREVTERLAAKQIDAAGPTAAIGEEIAKQWRDDTPPAAIGEPEGPVKRTIDFHRAVALLREHPNVAMSLGLVFEAHVDTGAFFGDDPDANHHALSVRPTEPQLLTDLVTSVWTRYEYRPGSANVPAVFRPVAQDPAPDSPPETGRAIQRGLFDLRKARPILPAVHGRTETNPDWALALFDVNGAAGALRNAYQTSGGGATTMPAIRSAGVSVLRPKRAEDVDLRTRRASARNEDPVLADEFTAEDLLLGYRVDIRENQLPWRSLCLRNAFYTVNGRPVVGTALSPQLEEGHVKPFAAVKGGGDPSVDHLVTDQVAVRWEGWSLAAPVIDLTGGAFDTPDHIDEQAVPYVFRWGFTVPDGALPKLRFTNQYQLRLRYVDLAGGGPDVTEANDLESERTMCCPPFQYYRYDAVAPPVSATGTVPLATGATADTLVIRSERDLTPAQLRGYPENDLRVLRPSTVPLTLVEQHKMFDDMTDERAWELIAEAGGDGSGPGVMVDPAMSGVNAHVDTPSGPGSRPLEAKTDWTGGLPFDLAWPHQRGKRIRLKDSGTTATDITMQWKQDPGDHVDELVITLAKGRQRTVELSATIKADFQDHFAINEWLGNAGESLPNIVNGRNQAITPVRRIDVVHAVRKPLVDPRWWLPSTSIQRGSRQTLAVLRPSFRLPGGAQGLDTESTGRLDIVATWTDVTDDGPVAARNAVDRTLAHFFSTPVIRGDPPSLAITHEFGDTKYRSVTYTLNAITRYRSYFERGEPDSWFHAELPQDPVVIASSARPAPLTVLGTYPAFAWDPITIAGNRIQHRRIARTVRVELARPWFTTGEGEQLGIVVAPGGPAARSDSVTRIARDPLFGTPAPGTSYPDETWFSAAGPVEDVTVPEYAGTVRVVPIDVIPAGDRWYADVTMTLPGAGSYHPFVELAVARYQPRSLTGSGAGKISKVQLLDRVPLMPDRLVTVDRNGPQLRVTVSGAGPVEPSNVVTAVLERASGPTELIAAAAVPDVVAWTAAAPAVTGPLGIALSALTIPAGAGLLRIRITEHESLGSSSPTAPVELGRRNVMIDTVDVPAAWRP